MSTFVNVHNVENVNVEGYEVKKSQKIGKKSKMWPGSNKKRIEKEMKEN